MFYSQVILARKGPLGKVWLAAHVLGKLSKDQISKTNIEQSADAIVKPQVPLALRLSGQLLLGLTRIYAKKVKYLYSEALLKLRSSFRAGAVDLPNEELVAPQQAINVGAYEAVDEDYDINMEMPLDFGDEDWMLVSSQPAPEAIAMHEEDVGVAIETDFGADEFVVPGDIEVARAGDVSGVSEEDRRISAASTFDESDVGLEMKEEEGIGGRASLDDFADAEMDVGVEMDIPGQDFAEQKEADTGEFHLATAEDVEAFEEATRTEGAHKRRRISVIRDSKTELPSDTIREYLNDASDITRPLVRERIAITTEGRRAREMFAQPSFIKDLGPDLGAMFEDIARDTLPFGRDETVAEAEVEPELPSGFPDEMDVGVEMDAFPEDMPPSSSTLRPSSPPAPLLSPEEVMPFGGSFAAEEKEAAEAVPEVSLQGKKIHRRTQQVFKTLGNGFSECEEIVYQDLCENVPRRKVASSFHEVLVLATLGYLQVEQGEDYGDIVLKKTATFDEGLSAVH